MDVWRRVSNEEALIEAIAEGSEVQLTENITASELLISSDKEVNIDLNGQTLTVTATKGTAVKADDNGTVTIEGGTIKTEKCAVMGVFDDTQLVVKDCEIVGKYGFGMNGSTTKEKSSALFENCVIRTTSAYNAAYISAPGTYRFVNCTLEGGAGIQICSGDVTLEG